MTTQEFAAARAEAETRPCPLQACGARAGQTCVTINPGGPRLPLSRQPSHYARMKPRG